MDIPGRMAKKAGIPIAIRKAVTRSDQILRLEGTNSSNALFGCTTYIHLNFIL